MKNQIQTRQAIENDVPDLCSILNKIIVIGGTTAIESTLSEAQFSEYFLTGDDCVGCMVAHNTDSLLGFQALRVRSDLPDGWLDIATFARPNSTVKGVGIALFDATKQGLENSQCTFINARIRADNQVGLSYYSRIGFIDYAIDKDIPLKDGTLVDRISRQFKL